MDKWCFEKRAKTLADAIRRDPKLYFVHLEKCLVELMEKAYAMGMDDPKAIHERYSAGFEAGINLMRPVIPVTDFSDIPEIAERVSGRCYN